MELVSDKGRFGALVWLKTNRRLIIAHEARIPAPIPTRQRVQELRENGWHMTEIATMFGVSHKYIFEALA